MTKYSSVPIAVFRKYVPEWFQHLLHGTTWTTKQPFRFLLFRELSAREQMKMLDDKK